jgi:hypothetical protein
MSADEKWVKAVAKLIELTQADTLRWERTTSVQDLKRENWKVEVAYKCEFGEHRLRLYRAMERMMPGDWIITGYAYPTQISLFGPTGSTGPSGPTAPAATEPKWVSRTILETIDASGVQLYPFPYVSSIDDLYNAVLTKTSGINDLLSKLAGPQDSLLD